MDVEGFGEALRAGGGDRHGAGVALALDPVEVQAAGGEGSAEAAGDVRAAFAPVEAGAAEDALAGRRFGTEVGRAGRGRLA